ncbi:MAG: subclass B3 metallo-beta-lactamase [Acidobacteria bacterium]|nr:subclass B3 metallo-beta-lactamase [Acidobacteriota bacterium]
MRASALFGVLIVAAGVASAQQPGQPAQFSREWYQQFRGPYSAPVEPFRIVGNIHYVGGANIASYLITTPQGHILIDTGMKEMHEVIRNSVAKLGFKTSDIKIMLSSHAHFDHIEGHAAMQKVTGAQVMAMVGDAEALGSGRDNSALGAIGWEPVKVARVLKHGDTVSLGGTTLRAVHSPGHTQGTTTWITTVEDKGRQYTVAFLGGTTPNGGVPLFDNPRHKTVIEDTQRTFKTLKAEKVPDIYLVGHPQTMFAGKVERITAGDRPHPLLNGAAWTTQLADGETAFQKRVAEERAKVGR